MWVESDVHRHTLFIPHEILVDVKLRGPKSAMLTVKLSTTKTRPPHRHGRACATADLPHYPQMLSLPISLPQMYTITPISVSHAL